MNDLTKGEGCVVAIIVVILSLSISWICTCGIIKLITLCFEWSFKWNVATGLWIIICLARSVFRPSSRSKK